MVDVADIGDNVQNIRNVLKDDVAWSNVCILSGKIMSLINQLVDWIQNYRKTVRMFPQIFLYPLIQ